MNRQQFSFPKECRIRDRKLIKELLKSGFRKKTPLFDIVFSVKENGSPGIVVITPKRLGNAVFRNRVRRRFKEIFRQHIPFFKRPFDMILFPKRETAFLKFNKIVGEFEHCLQSLNLL